MSDEKARELAKGLENQVQYWGVSNWEQTDSARQSLLEALREASSDTVRCIILDLLAELHNRILDGKTAFELSRQVEGVENASMYLLVKLRWKGIIAKIAVAYVSGEEWWNNLDWSIGEAGRFLNNMKWVNTHPGWVKSFLEPQIELLKRLKENQDLIGTIEFMTQFGVFWLLYYTDRRE